MKLMKKCVTLYATYMHVMGTTVLYSHPTSPIVTRTIQAREIFKLRTPIKHFTQNQITS